MKAIELALLAAPFPAAIVVPALIAEPANAQASLATSVQSTSVQAASPSSGHNLIVFRAHAEPTAFSPTIEVDGAKIGSLPKRHYTSAKIGPGVHTLTVSWPRVLRQPSTEMSFDVNNDEPHYFEVMGTSRVSGWGYHVVYIRMQSGLAEVAPDQAQTAIANCCRYKPSTEP